MNEYSNVKTIVYALNKSAAVWTFINKYKVDTSQYDELKGHTHQ